MTIGIVYEEASNLMLVLNKAFTSQPLLLLTKSTGGVIPNNNA